MTKLNRKLTGMELNDIHYIARNYFIDDTKPNCMDEQQFRTQCYTKAICTVLNIQGVEFPVDKNKEPLED